METQMTQMQMQSWTIEADIPMLDLEPPPTRRVPHPQWFAEQLDRFDQLDDEEAPTRVNGKVRVLGDPMELNRRGAQRRSTVPAPKHADGPGPSIHSVVTRYIGE